MANGHPNNDRTLTSKFMMNENQPYRPADDRNTPDSSKIKLYVICILVVCVLLCIGIGLERFWDKNTSPISQGFMSKSMTFVQGGSFLMGCANGNYDCVSDELPVHKVELPSFYIGTREVTFDEFRLYRKYRLNDSAWGYDRKPVINISWFEALEYCNWLSRQEGLNPCYTLRYEIYNQYNEKCVGAIWDFSKNGYRLPTEAEWEYAARGGVYSKGYTYAGTSNKDSLYLYANYCDTNCLSDERDSLHSDAFGYTAPVGSLRPNELGLYDMGGNVWEWCWDAYAPQAYSNHDEVFPINSSLDSMRIVRGGCWYDFPSNVRISIRNRMDFKSSDSNIGFRLARSF